MANGTGKENPQGQQKLACLQTRTGWGGVKTPISFTQHRDLTVSKFDLRKLKRGKRKLGVMLAFRVGSRPVREKS